MIGFSEPFQKYEIIYNNKKKARHIAGLSSQLTIYISPLGMIVKVDQRFTGI